MIKLFYLCQVNYLKFTSEISLSYFSLYTFNEGFFLEILLVRFFLTGV